MKIENVTVVGAGTMGHALALVHALGGCHVRLTDTNAATLDRALHWITAAGETLIGANALTEDEFRQANNRIQTRSDLAEATESADLIVEAVVENADVKRALFVALDRFAPAHAIIASNASYLDVFALLPESRQPRSVIAHWYTPPHIIDLVDLVPAPKCAPEVARTIQTLYESFGKTVLVFDRPIPGYIANRLQAALNLECLRLIDEGMATPQQIDLSIQTGLAGRLALLGHMGKADFTGLEMVRNGLRSKAYHPPAVTGGSPTLDRLIAEGKTGVVNGSGFFDYADTSPEELFRNRDIKLLKLKDALRTIQNETIS